MKLLSNKISLLILNFIFIGFNIYFFTQFKELNNLAQQEVEILDLRFGYSLDEVNRFFSIIGNEGRAKYAEISKTDMLYPISYGLLIISLLTFLTNGNTKLYFLNIFPVAAVVIDFFENVSIVKLMENFPNISEEMVSYTSNLTQIKWLFIVFSILLVLILFYKKIKKAQKN
ncbi:MAG: hypothetical protein ACPG4Y_09420 [Chitinophagales bacterium]